MRSGSKAVNYTAALEQARFIPPLHRRPPVTGPQQFVVHIQFVVQFWASSSVPSATRAVKHEVRSSPLPMCMWVRLQMHQHISQAGEFLQQPVFNQVADTVAFYD